MNPVVAILWLALAAVPQYSYYLADVQATGMKRLSAAQVIAMAELKPGRMIEPGDVEAAKARLASTGLFTKVAHRYRQVRYSVTVVFVVEEPAWQAAVLFDNFVGISDADLTRAVAKVVPTFSGVIPEMPQVLERVRRALEAAAKAAGQPGTVSYVLVDDELLQVRRYRFHLARQTGAVPVCAVTLTTQAVALRDEVAATLAPLIGSDYSSDWTARFTMRNGLPVLRRAGYLQARVADVDAHRETSAPGCSGARVTIALEAGLQYTWQSPVWNGNKLFSDGELDRLLGMPAGTLADGAKIDRGFEAVADAYRNRGHIGVVVHPVPSFDAAARHVRYAVQVAEGRQFAMGRLEIGGIDGALAGELRQAWELPAGAVFDASYPSRFVGEARSKFRTALAPFKVADIRTKPDEATLRVDVRMEFRPG
jgi:outer membrane protein assembly factor BamA